MRGQNNIQSSDNRFPIIKYNHNPYECAICHLCENAHYNDSNISHRYVQGKKREMLPYENYPFYGGVPLVN